MTTIATDGRSMAGDGLVTSCGAIFGRSLKKVTRLSDGRIVGCAGSGYDGGAFVAWLKDGGEKPKLDEEGFEALVLGPDGTCLTYDGRCHALPEEVPSACGSGRLFAIAAMDLGRSPEAAVEYAATRDTGTGGDITVLHLEPALAAVEAA